MKRKLPIALILAASALAIIIAIVVVHRPSPLTEQAAESTETSLPSELPGLQPQPTTPARSLPSHRVARTERDASVALESVEQPAPSTNKLERLTSIRETYRALSKGDPATALRAAKRITDDTERETALLTLVTEWTQGELTSPRNRAQDILAFGLEAGLGMELAKYPELAQLWANELTDASGRTAILRATAAAMVGADPASAFALSAQIPETDRRKFNDSIFASWASRDTEAALQWANRMADPIERSAAIEAIHTAAPVGIGAALRTQDGYPTINEVLPGTPAELGGQLHAGDRIVAVAQGNGQFLDAHDLTLAAAVNLIRGAPGTLLQLQILPAGAPPGSQPRTVSILRDQIKFKR